MWTSQNRARYERSNLRYPSDLTDEEWQSDAIGLEPRPDVNQLNNFWELLQLSLTEKCNLRCKHCTKDFDGERAKTFLPFKDFQKYLGKFNPDDFDRILLSDWGESTMMPKFIDYLRYANSQGWKKTEIVTNGTRLDETLWDEIVVKKLLTRVIISIESAEKDNFEYIRGFSFDKFCQFLSMMKRLRQKHSSDMWLTFNVTSMRRNLQDLPGIIKFARENNVQEVVFVHLNSLTWYEGKEDDKLCVPDQNLDTLPREETVQVFLEVCAVADRLGIRVEYPERYPQVEALRKLLDAQEPSSSRYRPGLDERVSRRDPRQKTSRCHLAYEWIQVRADGAVCPCCQMGGAHPIGNLNQRDFYSIWNGARAKELLDGLERGGKPAEVCRNCNILKGKNF